MMKNLFIGVLILVPLFVLVFLSYNPSEQNAIKLDEFNKSKINVIARASEAFFKVNNKYPVDCSEKWIDECESLISNYSYVVSASGQEMMIYKESTSLAWKEYCNGDATNILYSSKEAKTDFICGQPDLNNLKFLN